MVKMLSSFTSSTKGSETAEGIPKCMMIAKLGSETALDRAMAAGEIVRITEKGRDFYVSQTLRITKETEAKSGVHGENARDAQPEAFQALTNFVEDFRPNFSNSPLWIRTTCLWFGHVLMSRLFMSVF